MILIFIFKKNQQSNPPSPTSSRKDNKESPRRASTATSSPSQATAKQGISRSNSKGVPPGFSYIKRTNGASATEMLTGARTAHVSAVPRTSKLKVSGGTQTATSDFQSSKTDICQNLILKPNFKTKFFLFQKWPNILNIVAFH